MGFLNQIFNREILLATLIAVEIPLQNHVDKDDGRLYGTLMRTPGEDLALIIGLLISSGDLLVNEQIPEINISDGTASMFQYLILILNDYRIQHLHVGCVEERM